MNNWTEQLWMTVNVFLLKYNWLQAKGLEIVGKVTKWLRRFTPGERWSGLSLCTCQKPTGLPSAILELSCPSCSKDATQKIIHHPLGKYYQKLSSNQVDNHFIQWIVLYTSWITGAYWVCSIVWMALKSRREEQSVKCFSRSLNTFGESISSPVSCFLFLAVFLTFCRSSTSSNLPSSMACNTILL